MIATPAAMGTNLAARRGCGGVQVSERPIEAPIRPPATATTKPAIAPSGSSVAGHSTVHHRYDHAASAASPKVPTAAPATAPNRVVRLGLIHSATSSTTTASARYSGKC